MRLVELSQAGLGHARNVGLGAARGTYVTYVDDDDWITPWFLAGLLAHRGRRHRARRAGQRHARRRDRPTDDPDLDNYATRRLLPFAGQTVTCDQVAAALSYNAGKLLPTRLARSLRYDESLRSGEDFVYWLSCSPGTPSGCTSSASPRRPPTAAHSGRAASVARAPTTTSW